MKKKQSAIAKAVAQAQRLKRWSYSSWALYNECGLRFKNRYIDKAPEPPSEAMVRGTDVHTKAEHWLLGKLPGPVPRGLQKLENHFNTLRGMKPSVEAWWGVDEQWQAKKYDSWCVGKVDAFVLDGSELFVIDHKTGRIYAEKHEIQASLYAALGSAHFPDIKKVTAEFWYLDQGDTLTWSWPASKLVSLQKQWITRGQDLMEGTNFEPRPGYYCKWCNLSQGNGGKCPVG